MKFSVYNLDGKKQSDITLSDKVFGIRANGDLIHQVYVAISSNKRQILAHTKTRGERAGSGRKPWRQKGTGRARVGSVRTPIWRKGGIVFGPRNDRNYSQKLNKKMKTQAIKMVLGEKVKNKSLIILNNFEVKDRKTKEFSKIKENLKLTGSTLWSFKEEEKDLRRFINNLVRSSNILTNQLNVFDMLNSKYLIMSKDSIKYLEEKYGEKKVKKQEGRK